jgi:hypothetical protein
VSWVSQINNSLSPYINCLTSDSTGHRYNIPYLWVYMLLGQIVAISFAQNLFYLAIILSSASKPRPPHQTSQHHSSSSSSSFIWRLLPTLISLLSTAIVPFTVHTRYFMPILLVPHLLLFVPTLPKWSLHHSRKDTQTFQWIFTAYLILFLGITTYTAFTSKVPIPMRRAVTTCAMEPAQQLPLMVPNDDGFGWMSWRLRRLLGTIFEHPAVSSVSWDVICCTVSAAVWWGIVGEFGFDGGEDSSSEVEQKKEKRKDQ